MSDEEKTALWIKVISVGRNLLNFHPWKSDVSESIVVSETERIADSSNICSSKGWQRLKDLYSDGNVHFETGILWPCMEWTFIGTVLFRGPASWRKASERYHRYSKGRIFLNPRDALRRKWDYAFASFLRFGAINGGLAALYVGSVIAAITHVTAWRGHFSFWTVPAVTTFVPFIIAYPFGLRGLIQAVSLGLTYGLTLSLVIYSASVFTNQSMNDIYQEFKKDCEVELRKREDQTRRIKLYQKENGIWLKGLAKLQMDKDENLKDDEICSSFQ